MAGPALDSAYGGTLAAIILLLQFGLLRSPVVDDQVKIYIGQSLAAAAYTVVAGVHEGGLDLYVLAILTVALKAIAIPVLLRILTSRLDDAAKEVPLALNVPLTLILGVILTAIAYLATTPLHITGVALPSAAVAVAVAVSLLSLLLIATRLNSITQFIGFLSLDNAVYFGTVAIAPGLPLVLGILIFFPLVIAAIVFAILVDLLARRGESLAIDHLTELRG